MRNTLTVWPRTCKERRRRQRSLRFEKLEARMCPAFTCVAQAATPPYFPLFTCTGTDGNDTLTSVFIGDGNTIRYTTNGETINTGFGKPDADNPIKIVIKGLKGNDTVDFYSSNFYGFDNATIASIFFQGGGGNDFFESPAAVVIGGQHIQRVVVPSANSKPNIVFYGEDGLDPGPARTLGCPGKMGR